MPLIFGLLSILALYLTATKGQGGAKTSVTLFFAGLLGTIIILNAWLRPPRFLPNAPTSGMSVRIAKDIRVGLARPSGTEFLLLDGGSYAARGVDGGDLERRLSDKLGRPIHVLSLTLPGGNQYERWSVLRNAIALLGDDERSRLQDSKVTMLLEIHGQYDRYPLVQLRRNRYTDRAYAYLGLPVAMQLIDSEDGRMEFGQRVRQWSDVLVHVSLNVFNLGAATRIVPTESIAAAGDFEGLKKPARGYRFKGMRAVLEGLNDDPANAAGELPIANILARRERTAELFGAREVGAIYFSVPTPRLGDLQYARAFCGAFTDVACIDHGNRTLLKRLDNRRFWYDDGHLQARGAKIYTRWLAIQLTRKMKATESSGAAE
jgi:hypothetical protein